MKLCPNCKQTKPLTEFYTRTVAGKSYPTSWCKVCSITKIGDRNKTKRQDPSKRAETILRDCAAIDRKRGHDNDLDLEAVQTLLEQPCVYCGETDLMLTLDRMNNTLGHTVNNVNTCCVRCNIVKSNMPYEAWLVVARGMREARLLGLFGPWTGPTGRRG